MSTSELHCIVKHHIKYDVMRWQAPLADVISIDFPAYCRWLSAILQRTVSCRHMLDCGTSGSDWADVDCKPRLHRDVIWPHQTWPTIWQYLTVIHV